jgi:quinol monooxygenase YgiN
MEIPMTVIREGTSPITLINVFTVAPERQRELLGVLEDVTKQFMRHQPGFVSANFHASLDGARVVNYAQWESREHFEAMLANPEAQQHMADAMQIASAEPRLYEVASVFER